MLIILSKSNNGLGKAVQWHPPHSDKNSKIVKEGQQNVFEIHQANF